MLNSTLFAFIRHCCLSQRDVLNHWDYEAYIVSQIRACRRLNNWDAVEILQSFLCDAVMSKYEV